MDRGLLILLIALRAQWLAALVLLVLGAVGGAFLLDLTQLPGGLADASAREETHASAVILHVSYLAALTLFLHAVRTSRPLHFQAGVVVIASLLVFPFGVVLGLAVWRARGADWEGAVGRARGIGGRMRWMLIAAWWSVIALGEACAAAAYIGILSGNLGLAIGALVGALATQWAGLRGLAALEPRTKQRTYVSPFPDLPEGQAGKS